MEHTDSRELESAVEGILFASGEPVQTERICLALSLEREEVEAALRRLRDYYAFERRGIRLLQLEDRWQLCSSPDHAEVIRKAFEIRKPAKLSQPALEALTIIAYYQPTTRAYVDKLRGVDSAYTVSLLLERGLIETCGNLQAPGRPLLYRTTEKFLRSFHISSLEELPPLNEDDIPPQQLKIEDMALAQRLTETPPEVTKTDAAPEVAEAESASEVAKTETASESVSETETEGVPDTETAPESVEAESSPDVTEAETPPEPETAPETETAPENVSEAETAPEVTDEPPTPETETETTPESTVPPPLKGEGDRGRGSETPPETVTEEAPEITNEPEPPRELMIAAYPQILTARPTDAAKPIRRKPTPRKPYRYAGTFRTRRKRPGRRPRKRRRIARPSHAPRPSRPPERGEMSPQGDRGGQRRRLSGKAMRRCFYCLLCGCWLSWPFC